MTSRARSHSNGQNQHLYVSRPEKSRKNYQYAPKEDCAQDMYVNENRFVDTRTYPSLDSPRDNEFVACNDDAVSVDDSLSLDDNSIGHDGHGDEQYQDIGADYKQREKYIQDVSYAAYPTKRVSPNFAIDDFDDLPPHANLQRKSQEYSDKKGYEPSNDPQAMLAMRKLQRIRELERKRDYTEKYYAQEIRRLIGDQYYDVKSAPLHTTRLQDKLYNSDRNLENCGTMTTITRLNCGCVEQTTRPIFTTTNGRVMKRNCPQDQQVHIKHSTPNVRLINSHPHSASAATPKLKSKSYNDDSRNAKIAGNSATGKEATSAGRSVSPARKISNSSVFSA